MQDDKTRLMETSEGRFNLRTNCEKKLLAAPVEVVTWHFNEELETFKARAKRKRAQRKRLQHRLNKKRKKSR